MQLVWVMDDPSVLVILVILSGVFTDICSSAWSKHVCASSNKSMVVISKYLPYFSVSFASSIDLKSQVCVSGFTESSKAFSKVVILTVPSS